MSPSTSLRALSRHRWARHPIVRRVTGYSAGSIVALIVSEIAFASALGFAHTGTTVASAFGFVGGAVPNYFLNRRWAWNDRRGRDRRTELLLYGCVSLSSFFVSALVTHQADLVARHLTTNSGGRVFLLTMTFLGVSALFFVIKFVLYETVVFKKPRMTLALAPATPELELASLAS